MHADLTAFLGEAPEREPNRWERLCEVFEKLRLVLEMPALGLDGTDDLLEQLEQRLAEAGQFFPGPDWLADGTTDAGGLECYCANHVGTMLEVLSLIVERLAEQRAADAGGGLKRPEKK